MSAPLQGIWGGGRGASVAPASGGGRGLHRETSWLEEKAGASGSGLSQTISQLSRLEARRAVRGGELLPDALLRVRRPPGASGPTAGFITWVPDTQQAPGGRWVRPRQPHCSSLVPRDQPTLLGGEAFHRTE